MPLQGAERRLRWSIHAKHLAYHSTYLWRGSGDTRDELIVYLPRRREVHHEAAATGDRPSLYDLDAGSTYATLDVGDPPLSTANLRCQGRLCEASGLSQVA